MTRADQQLPSSADGLVLSADLPRYQADWRLWAAWLVFFGILSGVYPRDVHYDIAHYHLVNGWSIWEGRLTRDMAPAGMHSFLNPLHSVFIWWLVDRLPGPIVNGLLGLIQGVILPVLYALTARIARRLGADCDRLVIGAVALTGFLAQPNWMMLATLRHDHWGALAFLAIMAVLVGRGEGTTTSGKLGVCALALGLLIGMKPTNGVYAAGFAAMVLVGIPGRQARLRAVLACSVSGLAGIFLTGGAWHYWLWQKFDNPLYPMMTQVPDGEGAGTHSFRDLRFLPDGFLEGALRPVTEGFNERVIHDYDFFGPNFLTGYVCAIACLVLVVRQWLISGPNGRSRVLAIISTGFLATFAIWTYAFSIQRYAMAIWMLSPVMAFSLVLYMRPDFLRTQAARLGVLGLCGLAIITTDIVDLRRQPWESPFEPYVWTRVPDTVNINDAIIVFSARYPTSFTAAALEDAAWMTYGDSPAWNAEAMTGYYTGVREAVARSNAPVFGVVFVGQDDRNAALDRMADGLGLTAHPNTCEQVETAFDLGETHWEICSLARSQG